MEGLDFVWNREVVFLSSWNLDKKAYFCSYRVSCSSNMGHTSVPNHMFSFALTTSINLSKS